jgi:hypothetical protein
MAEERWPDVSRQGNQGVPSHAFCSFRGKLKQPISNTKYLFIHLIHLGVTYCVRTIILDTTLGNMYNRETTSGRL